MITMIPIWSPVIFVLLVAVLYVLIVSAFTYGNQQLYLATQDRLLFPTYARLTFLALMFFTGSAALYGFFVSTDPQSMHLLFALIPALLVWVGCLSHRSFWKLIEYVPLQWILLTQSFRVVVEIYLHLLNEWGLMPTAITWSGQNFDVAFGASAILMAGLYYFFGYKTKWTLLLWNVAGIVSVLNAARIGLLAAPTPFHVTDYEPLNRAILYFPYIWLPVFLVPMAISLHIVAIQKVWQQDP